MAYGRIHRLDVVGNGTHAVDVNPDGYASWTLEISGIEESVQVRLDDAQLRELATRAQECLDSEA